MNMYGQIQGPLGLGPGQGNYPPGPYLGGLYPHVPLPPTSISTNTYSNVSSEQQHQNPPSV